MEQNIYYKESGYDKTIYNFFIIDRTTKSFVFLKRLDKKEEGNGVIAGCVQSDSDIIKLSNKKFDVYFRKWNNEPLIENHNYTYKGI